MIVNFSYNTDTKEFSCTIDGQQVENFVELCFYNYEGRPYINVRSRKEENEVYTEQTVYAQTQDAIRQILQKN